MHIQSFILLIFSIATKEVYCYSKIPVQYHIQTDKGPDRYFRYQTYDGQYRREKRFEDGTVIGTYGWVDPTGLLRLYDYIADDKGYRIVRKRVIPAKDQSHSPSDKNAVEISNQIKQPSLRPLLIKNRRKPSKVIGSQRRRNKYKSVRQRQKDQLGSATTVQKKRFSKPKPLRVTPNSRRRVPSRRTNQIRVTTESSRRKTSSANPTFLKTNDAPDLGYDAPGGRITIDFDLGIQYRKEKKFPGGVVVGEHGYVDPLGILRKTYYRSDSNGNKEFKRSYWVGTRNPRS